MSIRWRVASMALLLAFFSYLTFSNFVSKETRLESPLLPDAGIRMGLDLQGGIHWVVGVRLEEAEIRELNYVGNGIRDQLTDDQIPFEAVAVQGSQLVIDGVAAAADAEVTKVVDNTGVLKAAGSPAGSLAYELTDDWKQEIRERTMLQVLEVLRRRIDDPLRGIPDSVVTRQGRDRVLVQIPGGQIDRKRARELLKSTGFLELKIVETQAETVELLEARYPDGLPEGLEIAIETDAELGSVTQAYLVPEEAAITGDYLEDARVGFDPQQRPIVNFTFNPEGGAKFGEITSENLQKQLAIILDDNVYSAPVIRSQINSRGQISGRFTPQQAADLAVVLRAGSLSVPVVIEEERTVGPTLGQDSIDSGTLASAVGLLLIVAFSIFYYRIAGAYAAIALLGNLVILIGVMSAAEATLTLPGIAGLVLTVGMAIDANVIIFERIREELRAGKTPRAAIATGFEKATWTVLDANITTLITAVILFEFGTGPIKGFAVTLSIGIVTSVFCALVLTRLLFQLYPGARPVEQVSI